MLYVYLGSTNLIAADVVVMETKTSTEFIDNQYDELIPISTNIDLESPIDTYKNSFGNKCMYNE